MTNLVLSIMPVILAAAEAVGSIYDDHIKLTCFSVCYHLLKLWPAVSPSRDVPVSISAYKLKALLLYV